MPQPTPPSTPPLTTIELPYCENSMLIFRQLRRHRYPILLDSCADSGQYSEYYSRFDVMAAAPSALATLKNGRIHSHWSSGPLTISEPINQKHSPFSALLELYARWAKRYQWNLDSHGHLDSNQLFPTDRPFTPGLYGYFGYDLGQQIKPISPQQGDDIDIPELCVGFYPWIILVDHHQKQCLWISIDPTLRPESFVNFNSINVNEENRERRKCKESTESKKNGKNRDRRAPLRRVSDWQSNMTFKQYADKFNTIQQHIQTGDCYQVNLAQRFSARVQGDPWEGYTRMRQSSPAPFAAYFSTPFGTVMSLSPERFITVDSGHATTQPIKGTAARQRSAAADELARKRLAESHKDRAENLMITDLLRNDFGKVCRTGSVTAHPLFAIETYANVHHMVSTISAQLPKATHPIHLLEACFPGGSITGAPKLTAMHIINELEPNRRHLYCGSVAHIGLTGNLTSSITIRTLLHIRNHLYCWAGGGIVADSTCKAEFQETLDKVNVLLSTIY